jgi:hypothetical protein
MAWLEVPTGTHFWKCGRSQLDSVLPQSSVNCHELEKVIEYHWLNVRPGVWRRWPFCRSLWNHISITWSLWRRWHLPQLTREPGPWHMSGSTQSGVHLEAQGKEGWTGCGHHAQDLGPWKASCYTQRPPHLLPLSASILDPCDLRPIPPGTTVPSGWAQAYKKLDLLQILKKIRFENFSTSRLLLKLPFSSWILKP